MTFWEVLALGIGLSMDAFAVALCKGLSMKQWNVRNGLIIAGSFGFFQALMPLLGWLLGTSFREYIEAVDHWVAFGLLLIVGGKMILDAIKDMKNKEEEASPEFTLKIGELLVLAVATSIDALAVGLTFAMLGVSAGSSPGGGLGIWVSILIIGVTTFILSLGGVLIGNKFGDRFHAKAELAGGIILVALGVRILIEHLAA